jgi:hypothetical protein
MPNYLVLVDALGYANGCALKGEIITEEQIGSENVERLKLDGAISPQISPGAVLEPEVPSNPPEIPETLQTRLSVGLNPVEGYELTEEDVAWIEDVKAGVVPVPFDADKISELTVKVICDRIEGLGSERPSGNPKKADAIQALREAIEAYFASWEVE